MNLAAYVVYNDCYHFVTAKSAKIKTWAKVNQLNFTGWKKTSFTEGFLESQKALYFRHFQIGPMLPFAFASCL